MNLAGHYTRGLGFFEQYKASNFPTWFVPCNNDTCTGARFIRRKWLDNHFIGTIWALNYNSRRSQITLGGSLNQYLGDHFTELVWQREINFPNEPGYRYDLGEGDKSDANVFAKIQQGFSPHLHGFLDLQLRRVDYEMSLQKLVEPNGWQEETWHGDYLFFNPKAGILHDLSKTATLYASFAVAQKEPNRDDFTESPTGALPKPERLFNTEAGFRANGRRAAFSANVYHMAYKDQLVLTGNINDVGAPVRRNVPDSYRLGMELAGNLALAQGLSFEGNATFSRNKIKNFTEYVDNWDTGTQAVFQRGTTDISFSPSFIAFGKLGYAFENLFGKENQRLEFALSGKHVGSQFMDNTSNEHTKLDAYTVSDFQIQWTMKPLV
ncbi:MAG: TonB-dependent receptor, partial [Bacteroidota bacterium]